MSVGLLPLLRAFAQTAEETRYTLAFARFAPLKTDLCIASGDRSDARPLAPHADLDYNALLPRDGRWIVFTSHRAGSADIFRVRPDGSGRASPTQHPAFDDQASLSPDGGYSDQPAGRRPLRGRRELRNNLSMR